MGRANHPQGYAGLGREELALILNQLDLRISIGEGLVLNCLHPEAMTLFNTCSDLLKVCWTLYDDKKQLAHDVGLDAFPT